MSVAVPHVPWGAPARGGSDEIRSRVGSDVDPGGAVSPRRAGGVARRWERRLVVGGEQPSVVVVRWVLERWRLVILLLLELVLRFRLELPVLFRFRTPLVRAARSREQRERGGAAAPAPRQRRPRWRWRARRGQRS